MTDQSHRSAEVAAHAFIHLLASQVITRLLSFGLNLLIARRLTPEAYGLAAVQFHLLNTTILFLAREGFRRGCLRVDSKDPLFLRKVLGTALLTVPLGAAMAVGVTLTLLHINNTAAVDSIYHYALMLQGIAALIELLSEPLYILAMARLQYNIRVGAEALATIAKSGTTLLLLSTANYPALAFSWGQIAYALATLISYTLHALKQQGMVSIGCQATIDSDALRLSGVFSLQAGGKLLLAEGGKAVLATASSGNDQGVYGLVTNLGSLVVRTVFQPFEEAAYVAFARSAADKGNTKAALKERGKLLSMLCSSICLLGLLSASFGPGYSYLALLILYGRRWAESGAAAALALYSGYLPLLAANGVLEAFVHAVADESGLHRANAALAVISVVHIGLSVAGVQQGGAQGLLVADAANMALRIIYCLSFTRQYFVSAIRVGARELIPGKESIAALAVAFVVTNVSRLLLIPEAGPSATFSRLLQSTGGGTGKRAKGVASLVIQIQHDLSFSVRAGLHIGVGVVCLLGVGFVVYKKERHVIANMRQMKGGKEKQKTT